MARTHFGREVFGAQPRDYADERREPEYYAALWPELAELVNAHWQELTPSAIGLPNDYLSMPSKDIERFVDHVEGFFAKKQREAEEKRDELNAVGKAAAREALALLAATPENQTAETQSSSPEFAMLGRLSGVKGTPTADDKLIKAYIAQRDGVPDGTPKIEVLRAISRNELTTVACDPNKRVWLSRKAALTVNKAKVGGHDPDKNMINKHARTLERRLNRALADMRPAQACK